MAAPANPREQFRPGFGIAGRVGQWREQTGVERQDQGEDGGFHQAGFQRRKFERHGSRRRVSLRQNDTVVEWVGGPATGATFAHQNLRHAKSG